MNVLSLPWLELAIVAALLGSAWVSCFRNPGRAYTWGLAWTAVVLGCTLLAWLDFAVRGAPADADWSIQALLFGRRLFSVDELTAPLVVLVALLHFLTALATGRTKMRRFSLAWSLAALSVRLATLGAQEPAVLIGLLIVSVVPPLIELSNRGRPLRVYALHAGLFVGLLLVGWWCYPTEANEPSLWATIALLAAVLIRCGTVPVHCWITDWFEHASFGNALLFVTPLIGVFAAIRLVLPISPDWALRTISLFSLVTAVYAAGMALVQHEARRFFAYLFLSHASLVLVGLELHTPVSLTGSLALWVAVSLSLHGLGLTLRALEARFGRLSLDDFHGLYDHAPTLALCFMLTGLASVGFPGTLGFISGELLVDGVVSASTYVGVGLVLASMLNGIAVVRAYFLLFTGARHASTVSLGIGRREWVAVLTLTVLIVGWGIAPQPGIASRYRAAQAILEQRKDGKIDRPDHVDHRADAVE
jgi:NADH-quinone oxidoreductase subunit M